MLYENPLTGFSHVRRMFVEGPARLLTKALRAGGRVTDAEGKPLDFRHGPILA